MKHALSFLLSLLGLSFSVAAGDGVVGITVDQDFTVVSTVLPEGPAAQAGVRARDKIISVNGYPTAKMKNLEEPSDGGRRF